MSTGLAKIHSTELCAHVHLGADSQENFATRMWTTVCFLDHVLTGPSVRMAVRSHTHILVSVPTGGRALPAPKTWMIVRRMPAAVTAHALTVVEAQVSTNVSVPAAGGVTSAATTSTSADVGH